MVIIRPKIHNFNWMHFHITKFIKYSRARFYNFVIKLLQDLRLEDFILVHEICVRTGINTFTCSLRTRKCNYSCEGCVEDQKYCKKLEIEIRPV